MTMSPGELASSRSKLREALAEAVASYAAKEAAASDPAQADAPPDAPPDALPDAFPDGRPAVVRQAPPTAQQAAATGKATGDGRHAARLSTVTAERDQYLDHLQRLKAEFGNYRKRVQRDNEALALRAGEGVIESLLPVIDSLQRALEAATRHEEGGVIESIEVVTTQLRSILASHGLEEVPAAPGVLFDPNVHEAVAVQESDEYFEDTVSAVLEPGYLLHDRLLRPARVIVAS